MFQGLAEEDESRASAEDGVCKPCPCCVVGCRCLELDKRVPQAARRETVVVREVALAGNLFELALLRPSWKIVHSTDNSHDLTSCT